MISDWWHYLTTAAHWGTTDVGPGLGLNLLHHLGYSFLAVVIALVIALPIGLFIGHTGKGATIIIGSVNASRALPTLGLIVLLYVAISSQIKGKTDLPFLIPVEAVLILLAIPPIMSNAYAGVQSVDPAVRDAAKGMGMTGTQVLWRVEVPNAYPLLMSGLRSATLQVIATATVGAYIGLDTLGTAIYGGLQSGSFPDNPDSTGQVLSGAFLVGALALLLDLAFVLLQRYTTSRGITGRYRRAQPVLVVSTS